MENKFKKAHTSKDLTVSFIIIAAGAALFFIQKGVGITVAIIGILCLLLYKGGYKMNGQAALLSKECLDLSQTSKSSLMEFLNGKDVKPNITKVNEGGSLRLDVYYSRNEHVAYAQLLEFSHFSYEPLTDIVNLSNSQTDILFEQL